MGHHTDIFNAIMKAGEKPKKKKAEQVEIKQIKLVEGANPLQVSLSKCIIVGNTIKLPFERLENYADLRKALINCGATYKNNSFIFPSDAEPFINRLMTGENINLKKQYQFFATPEKVAKMLINRINFFEGAKILEPSAGQGGLLECLPKNLSLDIDCIELMPENAQILRNKGFNVNEANFLDIRGQNEYDIIIANPPFNKNQDITHFEHMLTHLKPNGQMCVITSLHWTFAKDKQSVKFRELLDNIGATYEEIESGEFKSSGTNIKTILISI